MLPEFLFDQSLSGALLRLNHAGVASANPIFADGPVIRRATIDDAFQIASIYEHYVANTAVSFEEEAPDELEIVRRIETTTSSYHYLVDDRQGVLHGYAYAGPYRTRSAYRFTAETTVYVRNGEFGQGIGGRLYAELIEALMGHNIHLLVGAVTLPNAASEALHLSLGFERAGHLKEVGFKFGRWHDVALWQRRLVP